MKKLVISGSAKLYERALYWRGYFEGRGYEVIDWPRPLFENEDLLAETPPAPGLPLGRLIHQGDSAYSDGMTKFYQQFYKHLDQTDAFFLMNEDKNGIEGYIGPGAIAELTYVVIGNLNRGRKVDIQILKMPSKAQSCYDEIKFWLDQDWIKIYRRPTGKKATVPIPDIPPEATAKPAPTPEPTAEPTPVVTLAPEPTAAPSLPAPLPEKHGLFGRRKSDRSLDLLTCKVRALKPLTPEDREYLHIFSSDFPAWLLKYIAAPEFQRLSGVDMACGLRHTSLYTYHTNGTTFTHSIGVALIIWHFTHDKKQTLAGLFHDIAAPAFKHSIDFMNGDAETQESIEDHTAQIIRDSKAITRQLKKDGILPSEVSDYHIYPIADNDTPRLAADRLEYAFSNGLAYATCTLEQIKSFYNNLTIVKNEDNLDEISFTDPALAAEFTTNNLTLSAIYHSDKSRASMSFLADMIKSMINSGYLTLDDLYIMSEREIIDWILSCGDKPLSDAFRNFQRATSVYAGATAKKNCYSVSVKAKVRYIVPLVATTDRKNQPITKRITDLDHDVDAAVTAYLDEKQSKYVGFDFDFQPYPEFPS